MRGAWCDSNTKSTAALYTLSTAEDFVYPQEFSFHNSLTQKFVRVGVIIFNVLLPGDDWVQQCYIHEHLNSKCRGINIRRYEVNHTITPHHYLTW